MNVMTRPNPIVDADAHVNPSHDMWAEYSGCLWRADCIARGSYHTEPRQQELLADPLNFAGAALMTTTGALEVLLPQE